MNSKIYQIGHVVVLALILAVLLPSLGKFGSPKSTK